jgi:hypothetical protein
MMTRKSYAMAAALLLACSAAYGQNFNPTVEVTNTYQGNPSDVHKPQLEMNVPDSLMRFDLDFDYEVFSKRYEGSYNFKPYMLNMTPERDAFRGRRLYVRAGAGYTLHPELDVVFSPQSKGALELSFYASHKSYFGNYFGIEPVHEDGIYRLNASDVTWKGHDVLNKAGFEGRVNFDASILSFGAGYYGLMVKDTLSKRMFNALDFNVGFRSNKPDEKYFFYDVVLRGRYANDDMESKVMFPVAAVDGKNSLSEGIINLEGTFGPVLDYFNRVLVGVDVLSATYGGLFDGGVSRLSLTPRYELETGRWNFSLGLKLEALAKNDLTETGVFNAMHQKKSKYVYPAVNVGFTAADNVLVFAKATGGSDINSYSSLVGVNHHFNPGFQGVYSPLLDNSVEALNAEIGVKGNLWNSIQFEVNGGASIMENGLLESATLIQTGYGPQPSVVSSLPCIVYQDYNVLYAIALICFRAGMFRGDAGLHYKSMSRDRTNEDMMVGFEIPQFTADASFIVDFNSRVYAGVTVEGCTSRNGNVSTVLHPLSSAVLLTGDLLSAKLPGFIDLGLVAGYQINRKFGVWAKAGNLLAETIQRNPFFAEKGLWGTIGMTFSL